MGQLGLCLLLCLVHLITVSGSWTTATRFDPTLDYVAGSYSSPSNVVMVGASGSSGAVIRSVNGGTDWSASTAPTDFFSDVSGMTISSTGYFLVVSSGGVIYLSTNNGQSFSSVFTSTAATSPLSLFGVVIAGGNNYGFAVGSTLNPNAGKIYRSPLPYTTGTWTDLSSGISSLTKVHYQEIVLCYADTLL